MASDPTPSPATVPVAELEYEHSPLEDAVIRYRKQLILVAVLAVAGSTFYFGSKMLKEARHKEAGLAFTRASTVADLRNVASEHASQTAAGNARLQAAQLLAQDGKPREAIDELKQMLAIDPPHPLAEVAKFRLADLLLAEGASKDAVALFQEIANTPNSPYAALALLRVADQTWKEGDSAEAGKRYQEILTKHGGDRIFAITEDRLKQVKIAPPVPVDYVPEPTPQPGSTPGGPNDANMTPPSAAALEQDFSTPGLSLDGEAPPSDASPESLLPPPVIPPPAE